ncbi:MAG: hypothetical protein ACFFDT_11940, partial [Candidatus Hodarchaeota archaeon]
MDSIIYQEPSSIEEEKIPVSFRLQTHTPILINGNDDFHAQAAANGRDLSNTRDGSASSPYKISNLNISGYSGIYLIDIRNTDVHFQLSNNSLSMGELGVKLNN